MQLVSSAQNQEDIMLWRALQRVRDGFYIDVGAADPMSLSVTRIFYEQGWHGINLEPNPAYFTTLKQARPRDINLPIGAGREAGHFTFYNVGNSGLSTFDAAIAATHEADGWTVTEQPVETLTLAEICRLHRAEGPIHFLKIDVEGAEGDVLAGADFDVFRPWIVLVEATLPLSQEPSYAGWEPLLIERGYSFVWYDGLNRFYVSIEMIPELEGYFRVQPNIFDNFVSAAELLERADQAERSLQQANVLAVQAAQDTAETIRQTSGALQQTAGHLAKLSSQITEVQRRAGKLEVELAESQRQRATLSRQLDDLTLAESALNQRLVESLANCGQLQHQAEVAEVRLRVLLASNSWGMTAPYRYVGRLLRRERTGDARADPQWSDWMGKDVARKIFYRGMRRLLAIPRMRRGFRLIYSVMPRPVEWVALRYRAYDRRATAQPVSPHFPPPLVMQELDATSPPNCTTRLDLSDEEARIFRQLTSSLSANSVMVRA